MVEMNGSDDWLSKLRQKAEASVQPSSSTPRTSAPRVQPSQTRSFCGNCGEEMHPPARFCSNCGWSPVAVATQAQPPPAPAPAPRAHPQAEIVQTSGVTLLPNGDIQLNISSVAQAKLALK